MTTEKGSGMPYQEVSTFRRLLPQFLASWVQHLVNCEMGLVLALPTLIIPSVIGASQQLNPNETIHMTMNEVSWLAGILFILKPVGSLTSGFIFDFLGRKRALFLNNLVPLIGFLMMANANTTLMIFISFGVVGVGIGLICSVPYLSEICEPSVRGILNSFSGIVLTFGLFAAYLLGSFIPWRHVSYACAIVPALNILISLFVPETPIWLLSKKRTADAEKSLCWLRGWVSPEAVSIEFQQLKRVSELSTSCIVCEKQKIKCTHPLPTLLDKFKDMKRKRNLKPYVLVLLGFFLMKNSAIFATRPYIVQIIQAHGIALDANLTTVYLSLSGIVGNIIVLLTVRRIGKRLLYLCGLFGMVLSCFGLAIYGYTFFPSGWSSTNHGTLEIGDYNYFALAMFLSMQFFTTAAMSLVPSAVVFEVFPFKSRSFYCGIVGAQAQMIEFTAIKTYYDVEHMLTLPGVFCFFGIISLIGFVIMFFILPETERRSMEDIEIHFSDNSKSIFDIYIPISNSKEIDQKH